MKSLVTLLVDCFRLNGSSDMKSLVTLAGWLFWVKRLFETAFQSISGRLPEREKEREKTENIKKSPSFVTSYLSELLLSLDISL